MTIQQQLARAMHDKGERYVAIATGVTVGRLMRVVSGQEPPTQSILRYLNSFEFQELIMGDAQDS